jgi:hypothetical protein
MERIAGLHYWAIGKRMGPVKSHQTAKSKPSNDWLPTANRAMCVYVGRVNNWL